MSQLFPGVLLRRERIRRNWSQEGLCKGICSVSYLSKIEQGKTEASPEILRLLFARLDLPWHDSPDEQKAGAEIVERFYEALLSYDSQLDEIKKEFSALEDFLRNGPYALDAMLMRSFLTEPVSPVDKSAEPYFDRRQLALQRILQDRNEEAIRLYPCAFVLLIAGIRSYERGENYAVALEYLRESYQRASEEGRAYVMMYSQLFMGNCYCNQVDLENMRAHYRIAERLAQAFGDMSTLSKIRYNTASAQIESGQYSEAYTYFAALQEPNMMDLHKLAVCCEKLGRREEALNALAQASDMESDYPPTELGRRMCGIVRFRLEHSDYLRSPEYGDALLSVFSECRKTLPIGYASFHLPWVLEWYTATRQYRLAYELSRDFPIKPQTR
ncbi:MAG: helix-turn-helix domain-containing protein [Eubacterium sp.]|nr:helix-turn-helix domain-containing protein [Eubacterium sp.]